MIKTATTSSPSSEQEHHLADSGLPSCIKSGLTPEEERSRRRRTCRFIQEASRQLKLDLNASGTSMVIFHRFYAVHSFLDHDRFEVAMACLLLAAKTEECSRKLNHVIREAWRLKNMAAKKGGSGAASTPELGDAVSDNVDKHGYLNEKSEEFVRLKEKILLLERVVLHTIGFELSIDHPFKFILIQIKKMIPQRHLEYVNPEKNKKLSHQLTKTAMDFASDSLQTNLCLKYAPKKIALTCIYMGAQYCKVRPTEGRAWLEILDSEGEFAMDELASIAVQIMELIADKKGCDLTMFESIRFDLTKMKKDVSGERGPPSLEKGMNRPVKRQHL